METNYRTPPGRSGKKTEGQLLTMSREKLIPFLIEYTLNDFSVSLCNPKSYPRVEGVLGYDEENAKKELIRGHRDEIKPHVIVMNVQPFYKPIEERKQNQQL